MTVLRWLKSQKDATEPNMQKMCAPRACIILPIVTIPPRCSRCFSWKALLFNFWMSDRRPVQHALAISLARAALDFSPQLQTSYISTFVRRDAVMRCMDCNNLLRFWRLFKSGKKLTICALTNITYV